MLYLLGAMLLSMALQLDRHGLWNLLGPSLFALGILATAWVRVGRAVCVGGCPSRTWVQGPGYPVPNLKWAWTLSSSLLLSVPILVLAGAFRSQPGLSRSLRVTSSDLGSRASHS